MKPIGRIARWSGAALSLLVGGLLAAVAGWLEALASSRRVVEVRMAGVLGAVLVGMSTALEAIAARHAGLEVLGLSLVTNLAAGIQQTPLSHQEVIEAGQAAEPVISDLLARVIGQL